MQRVYRAALPGLFAVAVLPVRPNEKAPEALTTPGASFLGSGGGVREQPNVLRWYLGLADSPPFESGYAILEDMGPILQP